MTLRAVCLVCGDPMEARRSTRRYCSTRCRLAHFRNPGLSVSAPGLWDGQLSVETTAASPTPLSGATSALSAAPAPSESAPAPIREAPRLPLPIEVRHVPGEWLSNGYPSGIGGRTTYHVGGRSFDTPREALDFAGR